MIELLLILALGATPMEAADEAYRSGRYAEAHARYTELLVDPELSRGVLFLNLGNCAYREERYAEAILHYRRARLQHPRDREIEFNLRLAERQLGIDPPVVESFDDAVIDFVSRLTRAELLLVAALLQVVGWGGWAFFRGRTVPRVVMVLVLILGWSGAVRFAQLQWFPAKPEGVVVAPDVAVHSEPHLQVGIVGELTEGDSVRVLERSDRWAKVRYDGGEGWVERSGVGVVELGDSRE